MKWILLARRTTRWWSAPARFQTAPLAPLRKTPSEQYVANGSWLSVSAAIADRRPYGEGVGTRSADSMTVR
jgi:hypothetical protein